MGAEDCRGMGKRQIGSAYGEGLNPLIQAKTASPLYPPALQTLMDYQRATQTLGHVRRKMPHTLFCTIVVAGLTLPDAV
ncbi:hypothetical protein Cenrod_1940 [Candidatus Symbiobacter mobilis CR]|uniref:Uncharacterized protein n=1 Tax=Candidatus Symbiobacter mobilis CR TaxID=946483 RepID=U5N9D8_9BURK|nr:hypothetical protein Cenrod_1940 [Candidatus Symbiobacter mobilis CR]